MHEMLPAVTKPMRIAMLSDHDAQGGAARSAARLAQSLRDEGHEVIRLVAYSHVRASPELHILQPTWSERKVLGAFGRVSPNGRRLAERWRTTWALERELARLRPDIVNVHNIHGAGWDPELIATCAASAPVVWTLHDMWSMTARCAYAYDCRAFISGCGRDCPTPHEYPALSPDRIPDSWRDRRRIYERVPSVTVVTPSQWLAREARAGLWRSHRVEVIPYGVPHEIYLGGADRRTLRARFGFGDEVVALIIADYVAERRKGLDYALAALAMKQRAGLALAVAGHYQALPDIAGVNVHRLGFVKSEAALAEIYRAVDLVLHPAPVDNLPNTVLEAMACGTPTVAFPIGGLPDMVRPGETGWLARELSAGALADALALAMDEIQAGRDCRARCVDVSRAEYSPRLQARRYIELFGELLA
jgi:glycosyltransferase involved in cell wall biosynthesis